MFTTDIILSICIPTFNRSRYLNVLLNDISEKFEKFMFKYEIIISSNSSTDNTDEVVDNWSKKLPIIYIKQEENIGAMASLNAAYSHARGKFSMYLADDDFIELKGLQEAIITFMAQPSAGVLYAPWILVTLKNKPVGTQFFKISHDQIFKKGDHLGFLNLILKDHIFPEIAIFRTSALKQISLTNNDLAFWAFTIATDFLSFGDIIFLKTPFYLSTTHYFDDEIRMQAGNEEVEYAWDRYRGGLEYSASNVSQMLDEKNFDLLQKSINEFVSIRMLVGLRIRIAKKRNPIDTYYLARRLCGLGKKSSLPLSYDAIRTSAATWYLGNNEELLENKKAIIVVGDFPDSVISLLKSQTAFPVMCLSNYVKGYQNAVFLFNKLDSDFQGDTASELLLGNLFLTQETLMMKFS